MDNDFAREEVASALLKLSEMGADNDNRLLPAPGELSPPTSDDEDDLNAPIFAQFAEHGTQNCIKTMTNFEEAEIMKIWEAVREPIEQQFLTGRGKKSECAPLDQFFLMLCVLKHAGSWSYHAEIFKFKPVTFERMITKMIRATSTASYSVTVKRLESLMSMKYLKECDDRFTSFPHALYATDVIFTHANRPVGTMRDARPYYSAKHKLHGYKTEMSVLPNGICIGISKHRRGGVPDIEIFKENLSFHETVLKKKDEDSVASDEEDAGEAEPECRWAVLMDKEYQGAQRSVRAVIPVKKPIGGHLTRMQRDNNFRIGKDRVIVENYFGRLTSLWSIFSTRFKLSEDIFDTVTRICVALTNHHVISNPLGDNDVQVYQQHRKNVYTDGTLALLKRKRQQQKYRKRSSHRTLMNNCPRVNSDDSDSDASA